MERFVLLWAFAVAIVLLTGCTSQGGDSGTSSQDQLGAQSETKTPVAPGGGAFSLEEVSKHSTSGDCWMTVSGKVYNMTDFVNSGKHKIPLDSWCGKDATTEFNTRPQGPGTPHPQKAVDQISSFYVGDLSG